MEGSKAELEAKLQMRGGGGGDGECIQMYQAPTMYQALHSNSPFILTAPPEIGRAHV